MDDSCKIVTLPRRIRRFKLHNGEYLLWNLDGWFVVEIPGRNCPATISEPLPNEEQAHKWASENLQLQEFEISQYGNNCNCEPGKLCQPCAMAQALVELESLKP